MVLSPLVGSDLTQSGLEETRHTNYKVCGMKMDRCCPLECDNNFKCNEKDAKLVLGIVNEGQEILIRSIDNRNPELTKYTMEQSQSHLIHATLAKRRRNCC